MTQENPQNGQPQNKRYLHLASATTDNIDAFIDSLLDQNWVDPTEVVKKTLRANGLDHSHIPHLWTQKANTGDREGVLAVAQLQSGEWHAVINCPMFPLTKGEYTLQPEAMPKVVALAEGVTADSISVRDGYLHYSNCYALEVLDEDGIPHAFRRLRNHLQVVKNTLIVAYQPYFGADENAITKLILVPVLPDIQLLDVDADRINTFLFQADQRARDLFVLLMEQWAGMGYIVRTTPQSIVLDAPYGKNGDRVRLAILQSGFSQNVADYFEGEGYEAIPPAIILRWESLRQQEGIQAEAFTAYQQTVTETLVLRLTSSSAHVQEVLDMDQNSAGKLVQAMGTLASSIDHTSVKPKRRAPRSTPSRIQSSLDLCEPHTRAQVEELMETWRAAEGTVQCTRIGRIYLKMQIRAHKTGNLARRARRFNLLTLVCPQQGKQAAIQVAWGLADAEHPAAYLDCIPDAVDAFEETVSGLPGFKQQGTVIRLVLDEDFSDAHMNQLLSAATQLKSKEKVAP